MKRTFISREARILIRDIQLYCTMLTLGTCRSKKRNLELVAKIILAQVALHEINPRLCRKIPMNSLGWIPIIGIHARKLPYLIDYYTAAIHLQR